MIVKAVAKRPPYVAKAQAKYEAAKLDAGAHVQINVKLKTIADVEMIGRLRERFPGDADPSITRRALRALDESFFKVAGKKAIKGAKGVMSVPKPDQLP